MAKIGIVDTMFARVDMGAMAADEIVKNYPGVEVVRRTVPGVKDLPVECKRLLDGEPGAEGREAVAACDSCMAIGMVGGAPVDQVCAHEASQGVQQVKLLTNKHVIEVFVHENEAWSGKEFYEICESRARKHAHNAVLLVTDPGKLAESAGRGVRQGKEDEGPVELEEGALRVAVVVADFNSDITDRMEVRAREAIEEGGAALVRTVRVAGAFEIPLAAKKLLMDKSVDAVVALGAVVKGETAHDEVIVKNVAKWLGALALEHRKPVGLGIIGHDADYDLAEERAEDYAERAVNAAIGLAKVLRE